MLPSPAPCPPRPAPSDIRDEEICDAVLASYNERRLSLWDGLVEFGWSRQTAEQACNSWEWTWAASVIADLREARGWDPMPPKMEGRVIWRTSPQTRLDGWWLTPEGQIQRVTWPSDWTKFEDDFEALAHVYEAAAASDGTGDHARALEASIHGDAESQLAVAIVELRRTGQSLDGRTVWEAMHAAARQAHDPNRAMDAAADVFYRAQVPATVESGNVLNQISAWAEAQHFRPAAAAARR